MNRRSILFFLFFSILWVALPAHAQLVGLSFEDTNGAQVHVSPSKVYINPKAQMQAVLSSGLDRRIRLLVKNGSGGVVWSGESALIGPADRVTFEGRSYNGAVLAVPSLSDGSYTFTAEIISSAGAVVESSDTQLVVDKQPPVISGVIERIRADYPVDIIPRRGYAEDYSGGLHVKGVSDHVGLDRAVFFAVTDSGAGSRKEMPAALNPTTGTVDARFYDMVDNGVIPIDHHHYLVGFDIYDKAGNRARVQRVSGHDRSIPEQHISVWNPKTNKWDAYTPNMVVHQNPVRYRVGTRKSEHTAFNGSKFGLAEPAVQDHDANFAYFYVNASIPASPRTYRDLKTLSRQTASWRPYDHPVTLAPGIAPGPVYTGFSYHLASPTRIHTGEVVQGWIHDDRLHAATPFTINAVRLTVEPRPYVQRFTATNGGYCLIPAYQTTCTVNTNYTASSGSGYSPASILLEREGDAAGTRQILTYMYKHWDLNAPIINHASVDTSANLLSMQVYDQDKVTDWREDMWDIKSLAAYATNVETGRTIEIGSKAGTNIAYNIKEAEFSYRSLPDGLYSFEVRATDTYGHTGKHKIPGQYVVDNTPPETTVSSPKAIASLDEIVVRVLDTQDPNPSIQSIKLVGGPINEEIYLSWRTVGGGSYGLEYPLLFPSLQENEDYTLQVESVDWQGNVSSAEATFTYSPAIIELVDGMDGKIMIPAVSHTFVHHDGSNIIETAPITLADGSPVTGSYDVLAVLRSDAAMPMVVNGVLLHPGVTQSILAQHDFSTAGGKLSIPIKPAVDGVVGSSSLLITTSAPNSPVLAVEITTWKGEARMSATSWEVRQVIDPFSISVTPAPGVPCRLTGSEEEARASNPIRDPVCLVEWTKKPDESLPPTGAPDPTLRGQAYELGDQPLEYTLFVFNGSGEKIKVGSGESAITVTSAMGSVGYVPDDGLAQVHRVIQEFDFRPRQNFGPACAPTTDANYAVTQSARMVQQNICLFEWQVIPDGLHRADSMHSPALSGTLPTAGEHTIGWRVSTFSRKGNRLTLAEQTYNIEAIEPPAPEIELVGATHFENDMYMVPMQGAYLGDAVIASEPASLDVRIERDGSLLEANTFQPGWGNNTTVYRRINTDERALWDTTEYEIVAGYSAVPEVKKEFNFTAVTVPSESVRPFLEAGAAEVVDTELLSLKIAMRDQYKPNEPFNAETMGEWHVRIIRQLTYGNSEPLTDFVPATDGEASFSLDISDLEATSLRLSAEARLVSPIEGYERIATSARPAFLAVLRGSAIDAGASARRLSGQAPFLAQIKLELESTADMRAVGDVIWQIKSEGEPGWENVTTSASDRNRFQYVRTFEEGIYEVRAKVINGNSGLESYSETLEIVAYNKPDIAVQGQTMMFVGGTTRLTASLESQDKVIEDDNAVIEWSLDGGRTYTETGPYVDVSSDEEARFRVWARVRDNAAPEDDRYAYSVSKTTVQFRPIKAPRIRVIGPRLVEAGETYEFVADVRHPYSGMSDEIHGYFTLPDGSMVEGGVVEYTPTEEDLASGAIEVEYTAWIEGYRDQQAEASHALRTRVWQYVWPNFAIRVRSPALVAPADIIAQVREVAFKGKLEEPTFEWILPDNAVVTDVRDKLRAFRIEQPGDYTISVIARDARGNESLVEYSLTIEEAAPYSIDMRYSGSNAIGREPLDILVRPNIEGGHPRDRVVSRTYVVNGEPLEGNGPYGRATLMAGANEVKLIVATDMGAEAVGQLTIDVKENKLPVCSLSHRESTTAWIVTASCEDEDGRVRAHEWTVNGEVQSVRANRVTISKSRYDSMPSITVVGVDDSGGLSQPVTLH